ncbi:PTS system, glucose-specific IIB component [Salmonella enterica subsp. enterica serovar Typhimurium]|nr:PTS system, glucose-specific IIB component [Salmonella enterica subsp. enterica serovar Typhimurium]
MTSIEACMSRLRIDVTDKTLVDKALLKQLGAAGVR